MNWIKQFGKIFTKPIKPFEQWAFRLILVAIPVLMLYKRMDSLATNSIILITGIFIIIVPFLIYRKALNFFIHCWLVIATIFGTIMFAIIMAIVYFIILTPIALISKMGGKKFMDINNSGWKKVTLRTKEEYENLS